MENQTLDKVELKKTADMKTKAPGYTGSGTGYAAKTAIVKTSPTDKGTQVPNADAIKALKPGNTVIHTGTAVTVTEANKNTPQVKGMEAYLKNVEAGKTRAEALANAQRTPGCASFKLGPYKGPQTPSGK